MEDAQRFLATTFFACFAALGGATDFFELFTSTAFFAGACDFCALDPLLLCAAGLGSGLTASTGGGTGATGSDEVTSPKAFITTPRISSTGAGFPLQISN